MSNRYEELHSDIKKALQKVAEKNNMHVPEFDLFAGSGECHLRISLYEQDPYDKYAQLFVEKCDEYDLDKELIEKTLYNVRTNRKLKVIGIDPLEAKDCILLEDLSGNLYRMSPDAVRLLSAENS